MEQKVGYVYKLYSKDSEKIYIGSTLFPKQRLWAHRGASVRATSRFITENNKNLQMEIIEIINFTDRNELLNAEMKYVRSLKNTVNKIRFSSDEALLRRCLKALWSYIADLKMEWLATQCKEIVFPRCFPKHH